MRHALAVLQAARDGTPDAAAVLLLDTFADAAMNDPKLVVHRDPEIIGGTPVFVGSRLPVRACSIISSLVIALKSFSTSFRP